MFLRSILLYKCPDMHILNIPNAGSQPVALMREENSAVYSLINGTLFIFL